MADCVLRNGKVIGNYKKPYIVAEMNSSHNGSIENAMKMIDKAVEIGCDAVKFQSWSAQTLYSKNYYDENPIAKRMVQRFALDSDKLKQLSLYCRQKGIDFSSTPYSKEELDFLVDECDAPFVKVASMDINNLKFLRQIAEKKIAIVLSTGMATMEEIEKAVRTIEMAGNTNICVLHCVSIYPVDEKDVNLNNMLAIRDKLKNYPVGYSDHTTGEIAAVSAVANGAALIEKHFTLDNKKIGWDNQMACEPEAFGKMILSCNAAYEVLGRRERVVSDDEMEQSKKMRRSVVASEKLVAGTILTEDNLDAKRPYIGVAPDNVELLLGKKLKRDIEKDEIIFEQDIE